MGFPDIVTMHIVTVTKKKKKGTEKYKSLS